MKCKFYLSLLLMVCFANGLRAQLPAFDHIVIVIEENHSFGDIIGSAEAPNINALAAGREHRER
jgi:phospholipase C